MLMITQRLSEYSLTKQVDIETQQRQRDDRLSKRKYRVKKLTEEETREITKEIKVEEKIKGKKDKEMKKENKMNMQLLYALYESRNRFSLIKDILEYNKVGEKFSTISNKDKW